MTVRTALFSIALILMFASPVAAGSKNKVPTLTSGGNTIGGPGTARAAVGSVQVLASMVSENVCVTLANATGKGVSVISLELTDDQSAVDSVTVARGSTTVLCQNDNETVQVTCVGPAACGFSWRMDKK